MWLLMHEMSWNKDTATPPLHVEEIKSIPPCYWVLPEPSSPMELRRTILGSGIKKILGSVGQPLTCIRTKTHYSKCAFVFCLHLSPLYPTKDMQLCWPTLPYIQCIRNLNTLEYKEILYKKNKSKQTVVILKENISKCPQNSPPSPPPPKKMGEYSNNFVTDLLFIDRNKNEVLAKDVKMPRPGFHSIVSSLGRSVCKNT